MESTAKINKLIIEEIEKGFLISDASTIYYTSNLPKLLEAIVERFSSPGTRLTCIEFSYYPWGAFGDPITS